MRWPELTETFPEPLNELFRDSFARKVFGPVIEGKAQRVWLEIVCPGFEGVVTDEALRSLSSFVIPWFTSVLERGQRMAGFYFLEERDETAEMLQCKLGTTMESIHIRRRKRAQPSSVAAE